MQSEIKDFISAFPTEDSLVKSLEALFARIPEISNVQALDSRVLGKCLGFRRRGALGDVHFVVCAVRNHDLAESIGQPGPIANVILQVQEILEKPIVESDGEERSVNFVYVVTPYECPSTLKASIQAKSHQVTVLSGSSLLSLFNQYMPEFVLTRPNLLGAYLQTIRQNLDSDTAVQRLGAASGIFSAHGATLKKTYVPPSFYLETQSLHLKEIHDPRVGKKEYDKSQIRHFQESCKLLIGAASQPEFWGTKYSAETALLAVEGIKTVLSDTVEDWQQEFIERRRELRPGDRWKESELCVALSLEARLALESSESLRSAMDALSELHRVVERSNAFVGLTRTLTSKQAIEHPDNFILGQAMQCAQKLPQILRPRTEKNKASLPETLVTHTAKHLLIVAPPGYGKTSFCKMNAARDVSDFEKGGKTVPVFLQLHGVTSSDSIFIPDAIASLLSAKKSKVSLVRVYLDGLDEIPKVSLQHAVMDAASKLAGFYKKKIQFVVTARKHVGGPWTWWLTRVGLADLENAKVVQLANAFFENPETSADFFNQLGKTATLRDLMKVPLLATLIILLYQTMRSLPENKGRLYSLFIDLLTGGWDTAKGVKRKSKFTSTQKQEVLRRIAGMLHLSDTRECSPSIVEAAINEVAPAIHNSCVDVLNELVEDGALVRLGTSYEFPHLSFQEYLAARDIQDPSGKKPSMILRDYLKGDDWWREVISFYIGLSARPSDIIAWIKAEGTQVVTNSMPVADLPHRLDFLASCITDRFPGIQVGDLIPGLRNLEPEEGKSASAY